jgi:hypothetical protein
VGRSDDRCRRWPAETGGRVFLDNGGWCVGTDGMTVAPSGGLTLLLNRLWGQEVTHKLVLAELFRHTDLARGLGLWTGDERPSVVVEPDRGIFDLALLDASGRTHVFVELKFGAESGRDQRGRQRAWAQAANAGRTYILLGTSFFEIQREDDVHYVGVLELANALATISADGAVGELKRAYAERLARDATMWAGAHDPTTANSVAILRLYQEIADAWPVDVHPWRATNRGGPDWILNGDAWTTVDQAGWEHARFYWEIAGGRLRFKLEWTGDEGGRLVARNAYERALLAAAHEVGIQVQRTRRIAGHWMTACQLPPAIRDYVLVDGALSPERARQLYDDATSVFQAALRRIEPLRLV